MPTDSPSYLDETAAVDGELLDENEQLEEADGPGIYVPDGVDEGELLQELYKDLRRGEQAKAVLAEAEMRQVLEVQNQCEHAALEGLGELVCSMPLSVYMHWVQREGPEFFHQRKNLEFLAQRAGGTGNPGLLARHVRKARVTINQTLPGPERLTFTGIHEKGPVVGAGDIASATAPAPARTGVHGRHGRWAQ